VVYGYDLMKYLDESVCLILQELCGDRVVDELRAVASDYCKSVETPFLDPYTLQQQLYPNPPLLSNGRHAQHFTKVLASCSFGPGPDCIVSIGLEGFTCCFPRLKAFLQQRTSPPAFIIILTNTHHLVDKRVGLIDGILPDYRPFILFYQNNLLAEPPSPNVRQVINA
jgi:hypothetical protein